MRKLLGLATICLIVAGIIAIGIPTGAFAEDIKVGAVINLTGPASTWGQYHAKGQQDYFRYINEVKGGIAGNKIDLTVVDHAYKVPEALKYVKKFCTSDKMDMIATWDAGSGIMAKPIIQKYKVPNINYSTYQGILKTRNFRGNIFFLYLAPINDKILFAMQKSGPDGNSRRCRNTFYGFIHRYIHFQAIP